MSSPVPSICQGYERELDYVELTKWWRGRYESRRLTNACKLVSMRNALKKRVHVLQTDLVSRTREVYLVEVMAEI